MVWVGFIKQLGWIKKHFRGSKPSNQQLVENLKTNFQTMLEAKKLGFDGWTNQPTKNWLWNWFKEVSKLPKDDKTSEIEANGCL